jgi:hypothetical protein
LGTTCYLNAHATVSANGKPHYWRAKLLKVVAPPLGHLWWPADQTVRASSSRMRSQSLKRGAQRGARTRASRLRACTPQHRRRSRARRPQGHAQGDAPRDWLPPKRVRYGVQTQDLAQAMAAAAGRRAALCCGCGWCDRSGATEVWRLSPWA